MALQLINLAELRNRWGSDYLAELAQSWAEPGNELKAAGIDQRLTIEAERAEREVLSTLAGRYRQDQLLAQPIAQTLKDLVLDLARRNLHDRLDLVSEALQAQFTAARRRLLDFAVGKGDLGLAGAPPEDTSRATILTTKTPAQAALTLKSLEGW